MSFLIDKQTVDDLELFEKSKSDKSIFSLFNFTKSIGGKEELTRIFSFPLTNISQIENRIRLIQFFHDFLNIIEIDKNILLFIEHYLPRKENSSIHLITTSYSKALKNAFKPSNEYYLLQRGVKYLIKVINELHDFALLICSLQNPDIVVEFVKPILEIIEGSSLKAVLSLKNRRRLFPHEYAKLNIIFKREEVTGVRKLLQIIYTLDAYISVGKAFEIHGFTFPTFTEKHNFVDAKQIYHPFLETPIKNDFTLPTDKNVCFITGPNMAGKSTFLRTISISIYLSHLGFPVPAKSFETSLFSGLFTTINLSDNFNNGYSHYYNEVLRVKYIAEQMNTRGTFFIVFDELFRGTNIKDAFEASLAVMEAFADNHKGVFMLSTHIIEVAEQLRKNQAILFKYFEANLIDGNPQYNYQIKDGITNERIGMHILKKERVLEIIRNNN